MKNEEAISILEQWSNLLRKFQHIKEAESVEISKEELNVPALFADQYRKEANAIDLAIRVLKGQPTCEPLTLEQLREMDGQPVWVKVIGKTGIRCDGWCEVEIREKDTFAYVWWPGSEVEDISKIEDYGKAWVCYAYPPAHIDREAWTAEWIYPGNEWNLPKCSKCGCNSKDAQYGHKNNFCPKCGRAMTPEAWAELEKRMGVKG